MSNLLNKYLEVRTATVNFCKPLQTEDYIPQPVEFASPPKWHLAHTTWFFEQMILIKYLEGYKVFDSNYNYLFNSYYQGIGDRILRSNRGNITRPGVKEIYEYREYVDANMEKLLSDEVIQQEVAELLTLGINHEQQHQELLITDLKYSLGHNPIFPIYDDKFSLVDDINTENGWLVIPEGIYEMGYDGKDFCFDNELGRHKVYLEEYEIAKGLATNQEYIEFIEAGGYENFKYWLDEGWSWVQENQIKSPLYWHKKENQWYNYTLSGLKPVNPKAILCHISYYEASAYACWKNCRLPTEFEWEQASDLLNWGKRWEWTNSAYLPYPRFEIKEGAVGEYNGKFMVNQMVLRGASIATAEGHSRKTYRNFFHPYYQWQFSGIRLAKSK